MKSQALQELVKKIFSDEKTRHEFQKDPSAVIARFNLEKQEKAALMKVHNQIGLTVNNAGQLEAAIDPYGGWMSPTP